MFRSNSLFSSTDTDHACVDQVLQLLYQDESIVEPVVHQVSLAVLQAEYVSLVPEEDPLPHHELYESLLSLLSLLYVGTGTVLIPDDAGDPQSKYPLQQSIKHSSAILLDV